MWQEEDKSSLPHIVQAGWGGVKEREEQTEKRKRKKEDF